MLSDDEVERYARHLVLREVGGPGQGKIRAARVLVVGAGGLGSPVALYLAARESENSAWWMTMSSACPTCSAKSCFRTKDVGRPKVEAGAEALKALNPGVQIEAHTMRITAANALELIAGYDIVADGSDKFRHPLPAQRRLFLCQEGAGVGGGDRVRGPARHLQGP